MSCTLCDGHGSVACYIDELQDYMKLQDLDYLDRLKAIIYWRNTEISGVGVYVCRACRQEIRNSRVFSVALALLLLLPVYAGASVDTSKAVIHHTASRDVSAQTIRKWHVIDNGWQDIGYHVVIRKDGTREQGRSLDKRGAHSGDYRNNWIGIALTGYDVFTEAQLKSLQEYLVKMGVKHVERHHAECPGDGIDVERFNDGL